jgi:hypothetical protein
MPIKARKSCWPRHSPELSRWFDWYSIQNSDNRAQIVSLISRRNRGRCRWRDSLCAESRTPLLSLKRVMRFSLKQRQWCSAFRQTSLSFSAWNLNLKHPSSALLLPLLFRYVPPLSRWLSLSESLRPTEFSFAELMAELVPCAPP